MLKDITLGQFYPAESPVHRMDPRVKIMAALAFIVAIFFVDNLWGFLFTAIFVICVTKLSSLRLSMVVRGIKPILFLVMFTALINMFMTGGEIVVLFGYPLEWGPLKVSREGVYNAVVMALRLVFLVTGTSLLTLTTSPILLTDGIERLLSPFRRIGLPAHELAMMMTIALRFIPTLLEETDKIMKAQMARGADFESGNLIKRAKALIPILVPLFISSFRRADELATAMECRCYRGGEGRTRLRELKICGRDYGAGIIMFCFITGIALLGIYC
ncbi:MAG: energy-coupling factor transporter transmembrane protein EcfT [Ruminococcaceae bacterium]|nr:energy-coupling factor transporter transmembrane protein EcfT [Oscillospiraceae bacterium]